MIAFIKALLNLLGNFLLHSVLKWIYFNYFIALLLCVYLMLLLLPFCNLFIYLVIFSIILFIFYTFIFNMQSVFSLSSLLFVLNLSVREKKSLLLKSFVHMLGKPLFDCGIFFVFSVKIMFFCWLFVFLNVILKFYCFFNVSKEARVQKSH